MLRNEKGRLWAPFLLALALPASAEAPKLGLPIDCGAANCRVPRYVDRDPGPDALDFACGRLTSDGHKGTDFAVPPGNALGDGIPVLAAAPGRVRGVRDGMPDIDVGDPGAPDVSRRECGNGVVIDHGDGWESQYCHLRQGSVLVAKGEVVETGTPLGRVGMSGEASFVHLHFSLRHENEVIDPFRPDMTDDCGGAKDGSLWDDPSALPYLAGGVIQAGVLDRVPDYAEVKAGLPMVGLEADPPGAIVIWALFFGGKAGDRIEIALAGPDGAPRKKRFRLDKDQPMFFRTMGRKAPPVGFPAGPYEGTAEHWRGDELLDSATVAFERP